MDQNTIELRNLVVRANDLAEGLNELDANERGGVEAFIDDTFKKVSNIVHTLLKKGVSPVERQKAQKTLDDIGFTAGEISILKDENSYIEGRMKELLTEYIARVSLLSVENDSFVKKSDATFFESANISEFIKNKRDISDAEYLHFIKYVSEEMMPRQKANDVALFNLYCASGQIFENRFLRDLFVKKGKKFEALTDKEKEAVQAAISNDLFTLQKKGVANAYCSAQHKDVGLLGYQSPEGEAVTGAISFKPKEIQSILKDGTLFVSMASHKDTFDAGYHRVDGRAFQMAMSVQNTLDANYRVGVPGNNAGFEDYKFFALVSPVFEAQDALNQLLDKTIEKEFEGNPTANTQGIKNNLVKFAINHELLTALQSYTTEEYETVRKNMVYGVFGNNVTVSPLPAVEQFRDCFMSTSFNAHWLTKMLDNSPTLVKNSASLSRLYEMTIESFGKILSASYLPTLKDDEVLYLRSVIEKLERKAKQLGLDRSPMFISKMPPQFEEHVEYNQAKLNTKRDVLDILRTRSNKFTDAEIQIMSKDVVVRKTGAIGYVGGEKLVKDVELYEYFKNTFNTMQEKLNAGEGVYLGTVNHYIAQMIADIDRGYERPFISEVIQKFSDAGLLEPNPAVQAYAKQNGIALTKAEKFVADNSKKAVSEDLVEKSTLLTSVVRPKENIFLVPRDEFFRRPYSGVNVTFSHTPVENNDASPLHTSYRNIYNYLHGKTSTLKIGDVIDLMKGPMPTRIVLSALADRHFLSNQKALKSVYEAMPEKLVDILKEHYKELYKPFEKFETQNARKVGM